jgi:hypothetical protein
MTNEEIITELEYLIQRGVPDSVAIVLHTLIGSLKCGLDGAFAGECQKFAVVARNLLRLNK